jgi:hypothetical protein
MALLPSSIKMLNDLVAGGLRFHHESENKVWFSILAVESADSDRLVVRKRSIRVDDPPTSFRVTDVLSAL